MEDLRPGPHVTASTANLRRFFWLGLPVLLADCATKRIAVGELTPSLPQNVLGETLRFTLAFNRGAAMGLHAGAWSRWVFAAIAATAVFVLLRMLLATDPRDRLRVTALTLIAAGAAGNLLDRLRWDRGVVDFIDVGLGATRFYVFNVADIGVFFGGVFLAIVLLREERRVAGPS